MKYKAIISKIVIFTLLFIGITTAAHAQTPAQSNIGDEISQYCNYAGNGHDMCTACANAQGIWTAIGCIPASPQGIFIKVFTLGVGIAGGIAFLLILFGGFQILMSAGNPEQLNAGRELVSSAVAGLLLIIFSVFLLRLIGFDILGVLPAQQ